MRLSVIEIVQAVGGKLVSGDEKLVLNGVSTDTRSLVPGNLYVALKGPRFDGHDFLEEARKKGAVGAIVSQVGAIHELPLQAPFFLIQVSDTLKALGDLAHSWRKRFSIPVIGITGSSGKTSTKELIADCLATLGPVLKTEGNLNNLIGLPLTLFHLSPTHRSAVIEMGMNALGEIARLTEIAEPTLGLITNVGHAHLEGVGGIEGVAKAKGELFEGLSSKAAVLVNTDDTFISRMKTKANKLTFGFKKKSDIFCKKVLYEEAGMKMTVSDPKQEYTFTLSMVGEHYMMNWLACYAVCFHLGISPAEAQKALSASKPAKMRGEILELESGIMLINDAYNANPDSVIAALSSTQLRFPRQRKIAVLGDMLELGEEAAKLHQQTGGEVAKNGFDILLSFGIYAEEMKKGFLSIQKKGQAEVFLDQDSLNRKLSALLLPQDVILVKGSRGSQMERVVDYLVQTRE